MQVAVHENDRNHENDEDDEDNSDSYKQGAECWISRNHGNHGNDKNHGNPGCKPRVPQTTGLEIPDHRGQELHTNLFFFSNSSGTPGISRQNSRDILPRSLVSLGFEGHTELFGPHPFTWKTPTPSEGLLTEDPSTQESYHDIDRVFTTEATIKIKHFRRGAHSNGGSTCFWQR